MAESTDLEGVGQGTGCPANWDQTSTLVFRQVRGGGAITVSPNYLTVDIKVHTDALRSSLPSHVHTAREVFTLSWNCEPDTVSCQSCIAVLVKEPRSHIHGEILDRLSKDGFQQLRQFSAMMFQEYKTRLTSVLSPPVTFQCVHKDKDALETLASNIQELERKFRTYILGNSEFSFEFKICSDEFSEGATTSRSTQMSLLNIGSEPVEGLHIPQDELDLRDLDRLEAQMRSQAEHLESVFREQKRRNNAMRSTLRSVLEKEHESPVDVLDLLRRDAGDGAEILSLSPDISQAKPTQDRETSTLDNLRAKSTREMQISNPDTTRERSSHRLLNANPDNFRAKPTSGLHTANPDTLRIQPAQDRQTSKSDKMQANPTPGLQTTHPNNMPSKQTSGLHASIPDNIQERTTPGQQKSKIDKVQTSPPQATNVSNSDIKQAKPAKDNICLSSPKSDQDTPRVVLTTNPNSQTPTFPRANPNTGSLTLSSASSDQNFATKPTLSESRASQSPAKLTTPSVKGQRESKNVVARPPHPPEKMEKTSTRQHSSTAERLTSKRPTVNLTSLEDEESPSRANGLDTFFCFHTTDKQETDRNTKQKMIDAALRYIQGLEDVVKQHDVEENIAVIAKEENTWVKQKPTNDLTKVRKRIESLTLDPESLFDTLKTALSFMHSSGRFLQLGKGYVVGLRLVIISNHVTSSFAYGSPAPFPKDKEEFAKVNEKLDRILEETREIPCMIIVGNADRKFLRALVPSLQCFEVDDVVKMSKFQLAKVAAGKMIVYFAEQGKSMSGNVRVDADMLVEVFGSHLDTDNQQLLRNAIRKYMILRGHGPSRDHLSDKETSPDLPPVGSRVVRGEDWMFRNQDSGGPGTVVEHVEGGSVLVEWDNGQIFRYRYGNEDSYDVKVVHDRPKQNTSNSSIDVGCEVVRGPDWTAHTDDDGGGGNVGVVINELLSGELMVRWYETGAVKKHLFGRDGKYEVMLRDRTEPSLATSKTKDREVRVTSQEGSLMTSQCESLVTSQETSQACSLEESLDTSQASPEGESIWQWQDDDITWQHYSAKTSRKLETSFNQRPEGSCLVKRGNIRILFKEMKEKCLQDDTKRKVRRTNIH